MSRAPAFPSRRRAPSNASNDPYSSQPTSAPGASNNTRPLQIPRSPSRPTTPSNSSYAAPNTAPIGPLRPQRSELRARASDYSTSERGSVVSNEAYPRESFESTRSPQSRSRTPRATNGSYGQPPDSADTPASLGSVLSAFKSAGSRKNTLQDSEDAEYWREREREIEAEKARQQRIQQRVPGRRPTRGNTRGDIDAVLDQVKDGWEFVIDSDFSNVELALQLLDQSSLGKDMDSFRNTKQMLSRALKGSVDKHYQAFAASLPHHASLLNHLGDTQEQIAQARSSLQESKEALGSKRSDLVQLWNRGQTLEEMIRILDQIEHLKTVPDLLETLMSEKRLLQAAVLLVKSLKLINNADMQEIGAVSDLRSYLVGQETALRDILIDELQSHLYLKSFWCESRWAAYAPNQQSLPRCDYDNDESTTSDRPPASPITPSYRPTRLTKFLNDLSIRPNEPPMDVSDASSGGKQSRRSSVIGGNPMAFAPGNTSNNANPESDSFTYIESLLESLAVLGKLGSALDSIAQRLPGEVFSVVEMTLDEVEERAEYGRRRSLLSLNGLGRSEGVYIFAGEGSQQQSDVKGRLRASMLRLAALEPSSKRVEHEILRDLFWTLYSKLDAVAQGLRVVSEVANRIGSRREYKDSSEIKPGSLFPLTEVWAPVQAEVRRLISDCLTDEQQGSAASRNPISSINEILREGKFSRDRVKPVFRFSDTDLKSTNKALRAHEEGLTKVLKDTMPGLAPAGAGDPSQTIVASTDDQLLGSDQHHRLLIRPDAFHVSVLFQPTLSFLERMSETLPAGVENVRTSSVVLDEFVLKVYLPQLEEKVLELFHEAVSGPDAFQPDPESIHLSPEPLIKAATQLMALINSLCAMLQTSPFHRENYSRLILGVVIQFYQRCSDRFQTLTSDSDSRVALAAQWAQRPELQPPLTELRSLSEYDTTKQSQLCRQETNIEFEFLRQQLIRKEDLITSSRNLAALASLYRSIAWFSNELNSMKTIPDGPNIPTSPNGLLSPGAFEPATAFTAVTPFLPPLPGDPSGQLKLPLSREMAMRFQALIRTYDQLSSLILDTLRIDIRCRAMYYLDASMRHGNYNASYEAAEPDAHIVDLTTDLVQCNELTAVNLPKNVRHYVFAGLGRLMEHMTVHNARHLRFPNEFGMKKVVRNIQALQQSLRTLNMDAEETEFERAKRYFALFSLSPRQMLDSIKQRQDFTFDEYQTMLNLQCGYFPGDGSTSATKPPDRNYNHYVIELHGLELEGPER